jgi:YVTN family beta-propeller protein
MCVAVRSSWHTHWLVYVTDPGSNMVHVINGNTNNLTAEVNLNVNPQNSGSIYCNGMKISNNYTRYDIGTELKCTAEPNKQNIFGFKAIDNLLWRIHDIFLGGIIFSSWSIYRSYVTNMFQMISYLPKSHMMMVI